MQQICVHDINTQNAHHDEGVHHGGRFVQQVKGTKPAAFVLYTNVGNSST